MIGTQRRGEEGEEINGKMNGSDGMERGLIMEGCEAISKGKEGWDGRKGKKNDVMEG